MNNFIKLFSIILTSSFLVFLPATYAQSSKLKIPNFGAGNEKLVSEKHSDLDFSGPYKYGEYVPIANNPVIINTEMNGAAVVVLPGCTGVQSYVEKDLKRWSDLFLREGFVVVVANTTSAPRPKKNCGKQNTQSASRAVKDVYDAVKAASEVEGVDDKNVFVIGFSLGAMNGAKSIWEKNVKVAKATGLVIPAGVIGLYGGCKYGSGSAKTFVYKDTRVPLLWLMGSKDTESPPSSCGAVKKISKTNTLSSHHLYKGATHCWDCQELDGFKKRAGNGKQVIYKFNKDVTADSEKRALTFIHSVIAANVK